MEDLIKALQIFLKYSRNKNEQNPTHCEHDVMYVGKDLRPENMEEADVFALQDIGFLWHEGIDSWFSYRFGSA